nr:hypothetical protein [Tanacetum cinerariifolium]
MIDAAGYVTNVGRTIQQKTGSKTLDFHLANSRGQLVWATQWGSFGELLIKKRTSNVGVYRLELEVSDDTVEVVVVMFNETATSLVKCIADSIMEYEDQLWQTLWAPAIHWGSKVIHTLSTKRIKVSLAEGLLLPKGWVTAGEVAWVEAEESDAEALFVADTQTASRIGGSHQNTRKVK